MRRSFTAALMGLALFGAGVLLARPVLALNFTPSRVILSERQRTAVINVINPDSEPQRYTIQWTRMRMTRERGLEFVKDGSEAPELKPARDFVLYAPRQSVVPPNGSQTIRLMARPPADLAGGEYRSHLLITQPPDKPANAQNDGQQQGTSTVIRRVSRTTIPVIVRKGDLDRSVSVAKTKLTTKKGRPALDLTLKRTGAKSLYGDVEIVWRGGNDRKLVLNEIRGVAIYPELNRRTWTFGLYVPGPEKELPSGTLHVRVYDHADRGNKRELLAETKVRVP